MLSVNKVTLIGFVGKEPEVHYIDKENVNAKFSLATNESYINKNQEKVTVTEWHNIILWKNEAKFAEKYIKKGSLLYIEGKIRYREWTDKEGNAKKATEIYGTNVILFDRKTDQKELSLTKNTNEIQEFDIPNTDNLPF